jgi:long-subunit fatty acid transport protein
MKKNYVINCILLFLVLAGSVANAANQGAAFLKIATGARAVGLGQAFTSISGDIQSIYWNPAGIADIEKRQVFGMHERWVAEIDVNSLAVVLPQNCGNIGANILYVSQPGLEGRDASRQPTGNFTANDMAVALSYSSKLKGISYGVNLKFIQQQIENNSAAGAAIDLGIIYKPDRDSQYQFGAVCQNLGTTMKFIDESFSLPLTLAAGILYKQSNKMLLSFDVKNRPYESGMDFSLGAEYSPIPRVDVRAGYLYSASTAGKSLQSSDNQTLPNALALGFGVKITQDIKIDYAFTPVSNLGDTHHISFTANF